MCILNGIDNCLDNIEYKLLVNMENRFDYLDNRVRVLETEKAR